MSVLYLMERYSTVHLDGETLVVRAPVNERLGRTEVYKKRFPLNKISQVIVIDNVTVTYPVILALAELGVEIVYLTPHGRFIGRNSGPEHKHGRLRLLQVRAHDDPSQALMIAKVCVRAKLHNQRTQLLRSNRTRDDARIEQGADAIQTLIEQVDTMPDQDVPPPDPSQPQKGTYLGELMGMEGRAAASYFPAFRALLTDEWAAYFTKRQKRPPTDPVNALLSYGYTLLTNQTTSAAYKVGFDPYVGYLHSTQYGKPALALDIVEMFRAPIVDSVVLTLLNNRMLTPDSFEETLGTWQMRDDARKIFLTKYEERLNTEITHPVFKTKVSYRRCLELQMRLLSRWLLGELKTFRGFAVR
jgi:CRISPR-associated protein Cas1